MFTSRTPERRRDDGTTLPELTVTMMVFGMVLVVVGALYVGGLRTTTETRARVDETVDGRIGVSAMGRALRAAVLPSQLGDTASLATSAFVQATDRSITFYSALDRSGTCTAGAVTRTGQSAPLRVSLSVVAGELLQTKQAPLPWTCGTPVYAYCAPPAPGCAVSTTVLARGVQPGAIFTYYDELGAPLALGSTGASLAQLPTVDAVDIALTVRQPQSRGDGSTYALRVAMPNHDAVVRAQPNGS